jgi:hypothetical protein
MCNALFTTYHLHGDAYCVNGNPTSTELLLDPRTGVALVVCERLGKQTPLYPDMVAGDLVDSFTFSPDSPASS